MLKKSLGFCGGVALILMLDPSLAPAQPGGGKGGKGGFGRDTSTGGAPGGAFQPPGGGMGSFQPPGGGGFPGGGGSSRFPGGGGFPGGGSAPGGGMGGFQPPGGGGGFPGGGMGGPGGGGMSKGGGRGGMDPERQWSMMVNLTGGGNGETIDLSKIPAQSRPFLTSMAERMGTQPLPESGIWTKAQFTEFAARNEELRAAKAASGGSGMGGFGPGGGGFGPGGGMGGFPGGGGGFGPGGGMGGFGPGGGGNFGGGDPAEQAQRRIREQDKDGDGRVSLEEADGRLRDRFRDIDANGDGYIDAQEYAGYYAARSGGAPGGWGQGGWGPNGQFERQKVEEERPVAMRYGKLPGGLPNWYDEFDTDKDGQVSLYEWRMGKKTINDFNTIDLNGDGLITADEYLRFARQSKIDEKVAAYIESDGAVRPTSWGVGAPVDPKTDTKSKGGFGPGGWGGFPSKGGDSGSTKGGDSGSMKGGDRPEKGKDRDREGKKNPWSKGN